VETPLKIGSRISQPSLSLELVGSREDLLADVEQTVVYNLINFCVEEEYEQIGSNPGKEITPPT
jgi:hypothetical protein